MGFYLGVSFSLGSIEKVVPLIRYRQHRYQKRDPFLVYCYLSLERKKGCTTINVVHPFFVFAKLLYSTL